MKPRSLFFCKNFILFLLIFLVPACASLHTALPEMILIEDGEFEMGREGGWDIDEPVHHVVLSRPLLVAVTEVTRGEYARYCETVGAPMPSSPWGDNPMLPVTGVDWAGAVAYCNWLSGQAGLEPCYTGVRQGTTCNFDAGGFRLPTEAEWEYIAGGTDPAKYGNYGGSDEDGPVPVDMLEADARGLKGLSGNAYEWCWDWYDRDYYAISPERDPEGPAKPPASMAPLGPEKVRRSGSWKESFEDVLPSARSYDNMFYAGQNGFRLVRTVR